MNRLALVFDVLDTEVESLARSAAANGEVALISDVRSPRVEALQAELGAELEVATHRLIDVGQGLRHSDEELAGRVSRLHAESPLSAIVYATSAISDLSWYEPSLRDVPRGRVINGLLLNRQRMVDDKVEFFERGPLAMALSGDAATSDFVVFPRPEARLPEWVGIPQLQTPTTLASSIRLVDVRGVDTGESLLLVRQTAEDVSGQVLVVGSNREQGRQLQARLDEVTSGRVLFGLMDDPWIVELATSIAGVDRVSKLELFDWAAIPTVRPTPDMRVVVGTDLAALDSLLRELTGAGSDEVVVVVKDDPGLADLFAATRALLADIGFASTSETPMGDLAPARLRDDVVLIGPRARFAVSEAVMAAPSFQTFIRMLTEPGFVASAIMGLVPAHFTPGTIDLRTFRTPTDLGIRVTPPLLPIPNYRAEPHPIPPKPLQPREWVGRLPWSTRSRLALPWRWNLLPRAMRGRW